MTAVATLTEAQPHTIVRQVEDVVDEYRANPRIGVTLAALGFDGDATMTELEGIVVDLIAADVGQTVGGGVRVAGALADDPAHAQVRTAVEAFHARLENAALKRALTVEEEAWANLPKGTTSEASSTYALRMILAAMDKDPATARGLGFPEAVVTDGHALLARIRAHHGVTKGGAAREREGTRSVAAVLARLDQALRIHVSDRKVARLEKGLEDADVQLTILDQWLATRPSVIAARQAAARTAGEA